MPLGMVVGLGPGHIVLDGDPPLQRGTAPNFRPMHVCCGQTTGWIKMPLDRDVDLGPADIVLDGDPNPAPGGGACTSSPNFGPCIVAKRLDG